MLTYSLNRIRTDHTPMFKKPVVTHAAFIPNAELSRREDIVKKLYASRPYDINDVVRPINDDDYTREGAYRVMAIAWNYSLWRGTGKDSDWPANDNPMLVHAQNNLTGSSLFATINYFKKL